MSFIKDTFFGGAEKKAAKQRAAGGQRAIDEQRRQFGVTQQNFQPFVDRGNQAGRAESDFLGLNGRDREQSFINSFMESPGQAFLRERGERALLRNQGAIGGLGGGNVRKELVDFGIGTAAQQLGERKDRISGAANRGLGAVGQLGSFGANSAANIGNFEVGRGNAIGAGIEARASGIRGGLAGIAGAFTGSGRLGSKLGKLF